MDSFIGIPIDLILIGKNQMTILCHYPAIDDRKIDRP